MAEEESGYQTVPLMGWNYFIDAATETNPELVWPKNLDVFDKMRREDSQVISVLRACQLPIRSTKWSIDPAGARPEVVELVAGDLGLDVKGQQPVAPLRTRGRFSWTDHLRHALLELVYGHSFFEQVYRVEGSTAHLAKLAWRPPRTISKIDVAPDGGLVAIEQHPLSAGGSPRIPVDRLVAYVNEREGGNWLGQSLLRSAYKNWLLKDRDLRAQSLTIERNGLGVPVYTAAQTPDSVTGEERTKREASEKEAGLKITKGFRGGEAAGAALPYGAKLELLSVTGKLPDTSGPIAAHDEAIARAVLAHFLTLGTKTGSWALGSTFANFFTDSLNAVAEHIADVTQQHVIEDLVDLNFGQSERAPRLVVDRIGSQQNATAEAIAALVQNGVITPDEVLESWVRDEYGMPVKDTKTSRPIATIANPAGGSGGGAGGGSDPQTMSDAERARFAAETAQKAYLATDKPPLTQEEVRELIRRSGADLTGDGPDVSRIPTSSPQEGAA